MIDSFRIERDTMGDMQIPVSALYGPQTARAVQNFPISGRRFPRSFIRALGIVKSAASFSNFSALNSAYLSFYLKAALPCLADS